MHSNLFDIFLNWLPALVLLAVYVFFIFRMRSPKFQTEYIAEMRKQTSIFERIANALEKQSQSS